MAFVNTQSTGLQFALESSLGVLPGSPVWHVLEPNSVKKYGAAIKTVARQPISRNRQRRRGATVDLDSGVQYEADLTYSQFERLADGFMFCNYLGGLVFDTSAVITAVTSAQYTLTAGNTLVNGRLIYARGFSIAGNNGLKLLAGTQTATNLQTTGLAAETPPANVKIEEAGVRGASGDITLTVSGTSITIASTVLDFTTLPIVVGQEIFVGGAAAANNYDTAFGATPSLDRFMRVKSIAAHAIVCDKGNGSVVTDAGAGKLIDIYYGRFLKNVRTDDSNYIEKSYQFEQSYPGLANQYAYAKGNECSELVLTMPLGNKATLSPTFVGTDTLPPTNSRVSNAASAYQPVATAAFNTTSQVSRMRILNSDETALVTGAVFQSVTAKLMNNITPEKAIAQLGAVAMPNGIFMVDSDFEVLFTNDDEIAALRAYRQIAWDLAFVNTDGGIFLDMPSMSFSKGELDLPINKVVRMKLSSEGWQDPTLGTSLGVSLFPFIPAT